MVCFLWISKRWPFLQCNYSLIQLLHWTNRKCIWNVVAVRILKKPNQCALYRNNFSANSNCLVSKRLDWVDVPPICLNFYKFQSRNVAKIGALQRWTITKFQNAKNEAVMPQSFGWLKISFHNSKRCTYANWNRKALYFRVFMIDLRFPGSLVFVALIV